MAAKSKAPSKGGKGGRNEKTGDKAGSAAGRVLSDPKASKDAKSAAGSALTQRPDKPKGRGK